MKNKNQKELPEKVRCCGCRHFERDTEGRSFSIATGEYFMGKCLKGVTDGAEKVFANRERVCERHVKIQTKKIND